MANLDTIHQFLPGEKVVARLWVGGAHIATTEFTLTGQENFYNTWAEFTADDGSHHRPFEISMTGVPVMLRFTDRNTGVVVALFSRNLVIDRGGANA